MGPGIPHWTGYRDETVEPLFTREKGRLSGAALQPVRAVGHACRRTRAFHIGASGHETTDTDPGLATSKDDYSLERYVLLADHYQIELLDHLDQVPEAGALVLVSFPKPVGGSGFPARVIAIAP